MAPPNSKPPKLPIGVSDFRNLREDGRYYMDKTLLIDQVIQNAADVLLLPRPRRFGKTLNLSMLRYFLDHRIENAAALFENTRITSTDAFQQHLGRYPVVYLTFKDIKQLSWHDCRGKLANLIRECIDAHPCLRDSKHLDPNDRISLDRIRRRQADLYEYEEALKLLTRSLYQHHQCKVVVLIDEYDTPIHAAYIQGYYNEMISFMRNFLSAGLKDNACLFKSVITGILRVAKESIFSGLNNLGVYTLLNSEFNNVFGFTESEVRQLLTDYHLASHYDDVACWYNGYLFGGQVIYNPWSLLNFAASSEPLPRPYWVNTASSEIIERLATRGGKEIRDEIGLLLEKKAITKPIYDSIVLPDLNRREDLFWSFMLFSGYLKAARQIDNDLWRLETPNREVAVIYREIVQAWFGEKVGSDQIRLLLKGLTTGDSVLFERMLRKIVTRIMSFHDLAGESEKVYHALVLGMLVWLQDQYEIRSNRESGYGRYDLMLKPKHTDAQGIIIEFKQIDEYTGETAVKALENALKQIEKRQYAAELEAAGVSDILKLAIVFRGKELWVKQDG